MTNTPSLAKHKWLQEPDLKTLFDALEHKARFVGGCVRNSLLEIPITDIDIATSLLPEEVVKRLQQHNIKVIPTGLAHGTVTAVINHNAYEITTLRKDVACDGRHADVEFTDNWEEDSKRRDFSINAMSCTLDGEVFDYHNGIEDLKKGIIRFVGDPTIRCQEDYLRILRFFRFYAYYGKTLDKPSLEACETFKEHLTNLSGERIHNELCKLLEAVNPLPALTLMQKSGVLKTLFQRSVELEIIERLLKLEDRLGVPPKAMRRLCALVLLDSTQLQQLRFSNKEQAYYKTITDNTLNVDLKEAQLKSIFRKIDDQQTKCDVVLISWAKHSGSTFERAWDLARHWGAPVFPLSGKDLIDCGVTEGKALGELLAKAEGLWEENHYKASKEELLRFIKKEITK
jgi:poly(A) polymerase